VFAIYGQLPSYRAMLDREGAAGPGDVAIVGDEDTVAELLGAVLTRGNGAAFQRSVFARSGRLEDVVMGAVAATADGSAR